MLLGPALVRYSSNSTTNETNLGQDGSNVIHARWMLNTQNDGTDKVRSSSTIPTYRPGRRIPRTVQMEQMEELLSRKCTRRESTTIWRSLLQSQVQLSLLSHDPPFLPGVLFLLFYHMNLQTEEPSLQGVIFAALLIYFPSRPSQPPAPSSAVERTEFLAGGDLFICSWQVVIFYRTFP